MLRNVRGFDINLGYVDSMRWCLSVSFDALPHFHKAPRVKWKNQLPRRRDGKFPRAN